MAEEAAHQCGPVWEVRRLKDNEELIEQMDNLKEKLSKAQRQLATYKEKGRLLQLQYDDAKHRESNSSELVMELLERQRELNVMLNRSNIMLNRVQEAMALTSMEFNEIAKALPEPKQAEYSDRIAKVQELFKKTGIQDADVLSLDSSNQSSDDSLKSDELKRESKEAFSRNDSVWKCEQPHKPPTVAAELVEEEPASQPARPSETIPVIEVNAVSQSEADPDIEAAREQLFAGDQSEEDNLVFAPRRKSWWRRAAG